MMDLGRILISPLVWLAAFSAVYALHGLHCGHGIEGSLFGVLSLQRTLMAGAYGLAIAVSAGLLWALHLPRFASPSSFVRFVSRATGWAGLAATIWSLFPAVTMTSCL